MRGRSGEGAGREMRITTRCEEGRKKKKREERGERRGGAEKEGGRTHEEEGEVGEALTNVRRALL